MIHLAAYTNLLGTVALTDVPALSDDIMFIQNNHLLTPRDMYLLAAYVSSATLARARLRTPKLGQISPVYLRPINVGTLPANNPNMTQLQDNPLTLRGLEEIVLEATSAIATGTERFTGLLWLSDRLTPEPIPHGDPYVLRVTSVGPAVANAWTTIALAYEQQLPAGEYTVISAEMQSANIIAFRFIFDQQYFRPGFLGINALGNRLPYDYYRDAFGSWGKFKTISLPRCQVLCNAADAAFEGYIEVVRTGT